MLARLYDSLHEDHKSGKRLLTTPTERGGFTHRYFKAPRTVEEQTAARDAIAAWSRETYGWLGRSPDYKAAFLATPLARTPNSTRRNDLDGWTVPDLVNPGRRQSASTNR